MRQCSNSSIYQSPRWTKFSSIKPSADPMGSVSQPTGNSNRSIYRSTRYRQPTSPQIEPITEPVRVAVTSSPVQIHRKKFFPHSVDRFAPIVSTQLPLYHSQYHDPNTSGVDALAQQNWGQHVNFVNCPFRLIPQVLDIIQTQEAEATLIAPYWPGQPWFRRLQQMSLELLLRIPMKAVLPPFSIKLKKDLLGRYCADFSTSMNFGKHVDQNILNSFLRAPKQALSGATIFAKSNMAASRYVI